MTENMLTDVQELRTAKPVLPERYLRTWRDTFLDPIEPALVPGVRILDVGSGRKPALQPSMRPPVTHYVGLDVSADELERAPDGSYDQVYVCDVAQLHPELIARFDLIVSWQVLEHVKPLDRALENLRTYLVPGGRFVALFSGSFSAFGVINAVMPRRLGVWAMHRLLGRPPDSVFPAHYDHCWSGAMKRMLDRWSSFQVTPGFRGASYFAFSPLAQRMYLAYENWAAHAHHENLATHYLVTATR
jgi:SAM-dependent methyltransferase